MRRRICYVIEEELAEAVWLYARRNGKRPRDVVEEALRRYLEAAQRAAPAHLEAARPQQEPQQPQGPSWVVQNNWVSVIRSRGAR